MIIDVGEFMQLCRSVKQEAKRDPVLERGG
jgi:hypothetical protein